MREGGRREGEGREGGREEVRNSREGRKQERKEGEGELEGREKVYKRTGTERADWRREAVLTLKSLFSHSSSIMVRVFRVIVSSSSAGGGVG